MRVPVGWVLGAAEGLLGQAREWLVHCLQVVFGPMNVYLATLDPETVGRYCAAGLFGIALLWSLALRREFIFRGAPTESRWRDLRVWSMVVLAPYIFIYLLLF